MVPSMPSAETRIIGVAGARGAWGTALALAAARAGHAVRLWARNPEHADRIATTRRNERHLPDVTLPSEIEITSNLGSLIVTEPLLLVVPAQALRTVACQLAGYTGRTVICAKGLEQATGLRLSEVLAAELPGAAAAELSGPSFAREVASGLPTALTLAADALRGRHGAGRAPGQPRISASTPATISWASSWVERSRT